MTQVELWIRSNHRLGEAIIWHAASACLFWVDLLDPALFRHMPQSGETTRYALPLSPPIGSIAATTDPKRLIIAHRGGLSLLHTDTLALENFCDPEQGRADIIYNDIKVDRWGRLWVGTSHAKEQDPRGCLWCVADRKTWSLADAGFAIANGPAFSPDGDTLYFNDSAGRATLAYDISEQDLRACNRRLLRRHADEDGLPDGIVVAANGDLWCAQWAGARILVLGPAGELKRTIAVPAGNVTTLCFAGADLRDAYITTATDGLSPETLSALPLTGSLFKLRSDVPGLPEPLFRI